MGAAEDPDVEDYYTKSRSFPLTYSPEDDPEVIEDMRVAAAELERGDNEDDSGLTGNESSDESSESGGEAGGGIIEDDGDEGWEDSGEEDEHRRTTQRVQKRRKGSKMMSVIEKVHNLILLLFSECTLIRFLTLQILASCHCCRHSSV